MSSDQIPNPSKKNKMASKFADMPPKNESFMTKDNIQWFHYILKYFPDVDKPIIFLPCGRANKTRSKDGRKYISQGMSHQFMSKITRNDNYTKIILSEPLTLIPYDLESHHLRKDYNLPPNHLTVQSEMIFIHQVGMWLLCLKQNQPLRDVIFYLGATHHYFILKFANSLVGNPFTIIHEVPTNGLAGYSRSAEKLDVIIQAYYKTKKIPPLREISLEKHLKSRGRYTNKRFWRTILTLNKKEESKLEVCSPLAFKEGFSEIYQFN